MIFFGHKFIDGENLFHVLDIESINNTPPASIIYTEFSEDNLDIIKYCISNDIRVAVQVNTTTQIVYASALGASFIVVKKDLAKTAQNLADTYLFDAKILATILNDKDIEELALLGIDGVLYSQGVIKINS